MTPISGSKVSGAEAQIINDGYVVAGQGKFEVAPNDAPIRLNDENTILSKAIYALICLHPPNPLLDIPFTDVVAVYQFFKYADPEDAGAVDSICETINALSVSLSEKQPKAKTPKGFIQ